MLKALGLVAVAMLVFAGCSSGSGSQSASAKSSSSARPSAGSSAATSSDVPSTEPSTAGSTDSHGCPTSGEGLSAIVQQLNEALILSDVSVPLGIASFAGRYTAYSAKDQIAAFSNFDPQANVVPGKAGAKLLLTPSDADLTLLSSSVKIYKRASVVDAAGTVATDPGTPFGKRSDKPDASGRIPIYVPKSKGDYVYEITTSWTLPCIKGTGLSYVSVQVK